jgi:hypothetical protein
MRKRLKATETSIDETRKFLQKYSYACGRLPWYFKPSDLFKSEGLTLTCTEYLTGFGARTLMQEALGRHGQSAERKIAASAFALYLNDLNPQSPISRLRMGLKRFPASGLLRVELGKWRVIAAKADPAEKLRGIRDMVQGLSMSGVSGPLRENLVREKDFIEALPAAGQYAVASEATMCRIREYSRCIGYPHPWARGPRTEQADQVRRQVGVLLANKLRCHEDAHDSKSDIGLYVWLAGCWGGVALPNKPVSGLSSMNIAELAWRGLKTLLPLSLGATRNTEAMVRRKLDSAPPFAGDNSSLSGKAVMREVALKLTNILPDFRLYEWNVPAPGMVFCLALRPNVAKRVQARCSMPLREI